MQPNPRHSLAFLLLVSFLFPSCEKERSCEDCIGKNEPAIVNQPPIALAGPDLTITLPVNSVMLDGSKSSDPDGKINEWQWTKISGPSSPNITNANAGQTTVNDLVQGVYQFELKVTDAGGLSDRDTIQVSVVAVNAPPPCTNCKIVFVSDRDGNAEIYSCNADGSNISRLTNNAAMDEEPAWSPDRSHIAFVSDRTGHREIYIMNADGSNVVRRSFEESYSVNPAWSPDGARIAYSSSNSDGRNIWVVGATSGSPSLLFKRMGRNMNPSWSPDGTKLALVSDWVAFDIEYDIYTINSDGTNVAALTDLSRDFGLDYLSPCWSPNGTKIAVMISETIGTNQYNTHIGVMNSDGSDITKIKSGGARETKISWSSDGTSILYTSLVGSRKNISWVSGDGSVSGTIVTNGWNADWQH